MDDEDGLKEITSKPRSHFWRCWTTRLRTCDAARLTERIRGGKGIAKSLPRNIYYPEIGRTFPSFWVFRSG